MIGTEPRRLIVHIACSEMVALLEHVGSCSAVAAVWLVEWTRMGS